jgi:hypothetical protein
VLQLWDLLAVLLVYFACIHWGGAWLRDNWPAVAGPLAGALLVAEVRCSTRQMQSELCRISIYRWQQVQRCC